jgi:hypothetical protein
MSTRKLISTAIALTFIAVGSVGTSEAGNKKQNKCCGPRVERLKAKQAKKIEKENECEACKQK